MPKSWRSSGLNARRAALPGAIAASVSSVATVPVSLMRMKSLAVRITEARATDSGSFSASHASTGKVQPSCMTCPELSKSCDIREGFAALSRSTSSCALPSFHRIPGRTTCWSALTSQPPIMTPEMASAATAAGGTLAAAISSRQAVQAASKSSSGSISYQPACGERTAVRREVAANSRPARSNSAAFVTDVPTSSPMMY